MRGKTRHKHLCSIYHVLVLDKLNRQCVFLTWWTSSLLQRIPKELLITVQRKRFCIFGCNVPQSALQGLRWCIQQGPRSPFGFPPEGWCTSRLLSWPIRIMNNNKHSENVNARNKMYALQVTSDTTLPFLAVDLRQWFFPWFLRQAESFRSGTLLPSWPRSDAPACWWLRTAGPWW